ncbi:hypothetical protein SAMN05216203_2558 [Marinobacter daqiaonensis]|uniref:DUF6285 domain-containing protein n=1 Tax=Marinobacter daqiaonensis TaxID=650891 RepID=A0A1I6IP87_9GAMM|nr:DUF6285 domain-containing protein [Marinobacter daqiaonensis]SFR68536.1 hypothetical protein SAMN05216203_2558 [Marinobacter daqiaonensis]
MQDLPDNPALLASVEAFLRDEVMPQMEPAEAFRARVSANVLGMVRRHLEMASRDDGHDEREQLHQLTGKRGTLAGLTTEVCRLIAEGSLTPDNPRLRDYLWLTTLNKVAVDQPKYSGYRRAREEWTAYQSGFPKEY